MKRKTSTRDSSTTEVTSYDRDLRQTKLTGFLRSAPAKTERLASELIEPAAIDTKVLEDSDEDELVAVDQLLARKRTLPGPSSRTTTNTPVASSLNIRKRDVSPPLRAPEYAGAFSLSALLADREDRNVAKQKMASLEHVHRASSDKAQEVIMNVWSQKTDELTPDAISIPTVRFSVVIEQAPEAKVKHDEDEIKRLVADFPRAIDIRSAADLLDSLSGQSGPHARRICKLYCTQDIIEFLLKRLVSTQNPLEIYQLAHALENCEIPENALHDILKALVLADISGTERKGALKGSPQAKTVDTGPAQSAIQLLQLKAILKLVETDIQSRPVKPTPLLDSESDGYLCQVLQLSVRLAIEHHLNHLLVVEIESLMRVCFEKIETRARVLDILWDVAGCDYSRRLDIVRSLPTDSERCLGLTRTIAAEFFLYPTKADLGGVHIEFEAAVARVLPTMTSSAPFHPLGGMTDYSQLTKLLSILSVALTTVPISLQQTLEAIVAHLQSMHGRIVDGKAAFMDRSEAKAAIQKLGDKLRYTVAAKAKRGSIFDQFK